MLGPTVVWSGMNIARHLFRALVFSQEFDKALNGIGIGGGNAGERGFLARSLLCSGTKWNIGGLNCTAVVSKAAPLF